MMKSLAIVFVLFSIFSAAFITVDAAIYRFPSTINTQHLHPDETVIVYRTYCLSSYFHFNIS